MKSEPRRTGGAPPRERQHLAGEFHVPTNQLAGKMPALSGNEATP